ncbi:MAG: M48 family metalloprotease [Alphaproteobacteria bacterium]
MRLLTILLVVLCLLGSPVQADSNRRTVIRDAEIENTIRAFATPLFQSAGIAPDSVRLHILADKSLNAFVADGLNMYIHTALLLKTETANQLIGVLAHETGHIAGGHLVTLRDEVAQAQTEALLAAALGAAAAMATGRGDVGGAIAMGGQELAMRSLFAFTRTQEQSADQAAMRLLDATKQSPRGMLDFFEVLGDQELLSVRQQDPYVRTHPITRDRIEFVRHHLDSAPGGESPANPAFEAMFQRIKAKLFAFTEPAARTFARYKEADRSVHARYARAVAFYRKADLGQARPLIDGLIAEQPDDPYFSELKGQMLFENGRLNEALEPYRKAVRLLPDSALLRTSLAQVLVELDDAALQREAVGHLDAALQREPESAFAWRLMSIIHGRSGNMGVASLAMAEFAMLTGALDEAIYHAGRAAALLPKNTPSLVRAQDIQTSAMALKKKMRQKDPRDR